MTKKLLIILKITMLISVLFFASCNESSDTATPNDTTGTGDNGTGDNGNQDTAIGEVIGTVEGTVSSIASRTPDFGKAYDGVTAMTCTLKVEETGKSPITYNGACDKDHWEKTISFSDKEANPSISASLVNSGRSKGIEYQVDGTSKVEAIKAGTTGATTTKVTRENNVWEGEMTTTDGTDLLKLTITTEDTKVISVGDSCQFIKKIIYDSSLDNYTLDGYCVLARDVNGDVTNIRFNSSLANPNVTVSLPVGIIAIDESNRPQVEYAYRIRGYFYQDIDYLIGGSDPFTINVNDNNDNTFTAEFKQNKDNSTSLEFDIVINDN